MRPLILIILLVIGSSLQVVAQRAIVIKDTATFYSKPSAKSKVIFTVKKGASFKLESLDSTHGWYYVSAVAGNVKGWIYGNSIKITGVRSETEEGERKQPDYSTLYKNEWQMFTTTPQGVVYSFNPSTIKKDGLSVSIWAWTVEGKSVNKKTMYLEQFNCREDRYRLLSVVEYGDDGDLKKSTETPEASWSAIVPESTSDTLKGLVCDLAK